MRPLRFLLVATIAVLMMNEGDTLKCWICGSRGPEGPGCSDPFLGSADVKDDRMFIKECGKGNDFHVQLFPNGTTTHTQSLSPGLEFVCFKFTRTVLGSKVVMRGCVTGLPNITQGSCMDAEPQKETGGNILTCDACAEDLCNGAASVGVVAMLIAPLLLMVLM